MTPSIDFSALETSIAPTTSKKSEQEEEQATRIQDTLAMLRNMQASGTLKAGVSAVIRDHHNPQSAISRNSDQTDRHLLSFQTLQETLYSKVWPVSQSRYHAQKWAEASDAAVSKHGGLAEQAAANSRVYEALNAYEARQRAIAGSVEAWTKLANRTLEATSLVEEAPERGQERSSATLDDNDSEKDVEQLSDDGKKDVEARDGAEVLE